MQALLVGLNSRGGNLLECAGRHRARSLSVGVSFTDLRTLPSFHLNIERFITACSISRVSVGGKNGALDSVPLSRFLQLRGGIPFKGPVSLQLKFYHLFKKVTD